MLRAIAQTILKCQDDWNHISTSLFDHLESYGEDDANPCELAAGTKFGDLGVSCSRRGTPFAMVHDTWHGQLVADLYRVFLVYAEKVRGIKVLIRAPTGFTSVNAVLDAI